MMPPRGLPHIGLRLRASANVLNSASAFLDTYATRPLKEALIHPSALRNCPKRRASARGAAPWTAVNSVFGPFGPPYVVRIRLRSLPRTPFRTVSEEEFSEVDRRCLVRRR